MSIASFTFHIGILIVPIFLVSHVDLWKRSLGISWIGLPLNAADVLTVLTIVSAVVLFLRHRPIKRISAA